MEGEVGFIAEQGWGARARSGGVNNGCICLKKVHTFLVHYPPSRLEIPIWSNAMPCHAMLSFLLRSLSM